MIASGLRQAGNVKAKRLALLAEDLEPNRPPYWVSRPGRSTPSQGWWWVPQGERYPQFLGHNAAKAEVNLSYLLELRT